MKKRVLGLAFVLCLMLGLFPTKVWANSNPAIPKAGSAYGPTGTTTGQPFAAGTGGSTKFRIPGLITLANGGLVAVADARYSTHIDGGGLDTILSISMDDGKTWNYSFPIYFPDSNGYNGNKATTVIDPAVIQGSDGTIYVIADVNPTGVTTYTGFTMPKAGTGYITVRENGVDVKRLALTSVYSNANTAPTDNNTNVYQYYVGDLNTNGYAPVILRTTGQPSNYAVDEYYNLYRVENNTYTALTQTQTNSSTTIQQNVFYAASELHVYNTGYLWLASSKDNGQTWHHTILNPQIKRATETAVLVSPGRGTLLADGTIVIPFYNHYDTATSPNVERASFIWSKDNGQTWHRTQDAPNNLGFSSESEIVELEDGTLRMFFRNGKNTICYADARWNDGTNNYTWSNAVSTGVACRSSCNISAIMYSKQIDGKDAILVACPGDTGSRTKGRIFTFLVDNSNNSMKLAYTFHVNEGKFAYSCLTELKNGKVGLLWENDDAAITFSTYDITKVAPGQIIEPVLPVTGGTGNLGRDASFTGSTVPLSNALFTFSANGNGSYTVASRTTAGTKVYLHVHHPGFPLDTDSAGAITLTQNTDGTFHIKSSSSLYNGYLYFYRFGQNYFDQYLVTREATKFLLYRPVGQGDVSSTEVPGYVRVTSSSEVENGGRYLILAKVGDNYYGLYPYAGTPGWVDGSRYPYVIKVNR